MAPELQYHQGCQEIKYLYEILNCLSRKFRFHYFYLLYWQCSTIEIKLMSIHTLYSRQTAPARCYKVIVGREGWCYHNCPAMPGLCLQSDDLNNSQCVLISIISSECDTQSSPGLMGCFSLLEGILTRSCAVSDLTFSLIDWGWYLELAGAGSNGVK